MTQEFLQSRKKMHLKEETGSQSKDYLKKLFEFQIQK